MSTLHTVNKSPFQTNSLDRCLQMAKDGSSVLLIEDGVIGAIKGSEISSKIESAMKNVSIYALSPDLEARGIQDRVLDGVKVVDYSGFVDLAADHDKVQSWL